MLPRKRLVNESVTRLYHVFSRCVRRELLFGGEKYERRKLWLAQRLELLAKIYAIDVVAFAWMDNHFHLIVRLDASRVDDWTNDEVVRRWALLWPPTKNGEFLETGPGSEYYATKINDLPFLAKARKALGNLGNFMKALKQYIARMANVDDGQKGAFFEGRYKSVALLDDAAVIAAMAYVDLNPFAAGVGELPEDSPYTSLFERLAHLQEQGVPKEVVQDANADDRTLEGTQAAQAAAKAMTEAERTGWLLPIYDERQYDLPNADPSRPGASDRVDPATYFRIVDALARKAREGKASLDKEAPSIFDRLTLTTNGVLFWETLKKLERMTDTGAFVRALGSPEELKKAADKVNPDKSKRSWFVVNKKALRPDTDAS